MNLFQQTQQRILENLDAEIEILHKAKDDIKRFEDLCNQLCANDLKFEPGVTIMPHKAAYQISTVPEHAGGIMLFLCSKGCIETDQRSAELYEPNDCSIYDITGPCAPPFKLIVSKNTYIRENNCIATAARIACGAEVEP